MPLSKSSFKSYLQCSSYFWFTQNKPEVLAPSTLDDFAQMLADQGKVVEKEFYKLYPDAEFVVSKGQASVDETRTKIASGVSHIAQAGFSTADFFAQSDLVHFKGNNHIDIYEIKSSSSMQNAGLEDTAQAPTKEEHLYDLAFQYQVATKAGYVVDHLFLVELNKSYSRSGELDLRALFAIHEVTEEVMIIASGVQTLMGAALVTATLPIQPTTCECRYLPRKKQCPAFSYLHPELMEYGVYDLSYIGRSPKRLRKFVDDGMTRINDIPDNYDLLESYREQVHTWNRNEELILHHEIQRELEKLQYPLYFLDYETTSTAIPLYDGVRPYQHIPFQYSLHIQDSHDAEIRHLEYLHLGRESPMQAISRKLREDISDQGTVIVWNKKFEMKCNENLAETVTDLASFLMGINRRVFDLMEIFSKHLYVHKDFRGSSSIKKVLPVLVPELSYASLEISDGGTATTQWANMIFNMTDDDEKKVIQQQLLEYCKLDTLAMVEIYRKVIEKIQN